MKLFLAEIPDLCGYGICLLDTDKKRAESRLRKEYQKWRDAWVLPFTYSEALDYFGGGVREIDTDTIFNDGFKN